MTTCVLCHADLAGAPIVNEMARHNTPQVSKRCRSCDLVQADPKPEPHTLRRFYEDGSYRKLYPLTPTPGLYQATLDPAFIEERARALVERYRGLVNYVVYDHGCGDGSTMAALRNLTRYTPISPPDCHVFGWDADPAMRDLAARLNGVFDLSATTRAPNLVTAHHVLEHDLDPVALVRMLASKAVSGGTVHVEVPDVEAFTSQDDWQMPHVVNFSASTLRRTLEAGGLHDVQTAKLGAFLVGWGRV